ncbi:MAG: RING-HC finger protein [Endozoicomonas sp.]|uniref:RING-HC finger protein n=1 Tax=Endozoicomonas sp. TaxID=1892382 RepID=UPI003D9BA52B
MKTANYWQMKIIQSLLSFLLFITGSIHAMESVISLVIATNQWHQLQKAPPALNQTVSSSQYLLPEPLPQTSPPGKQVRYFLVPEHPTTPPIIHYNCIKNLTLHVHDDVSPLYLPDKPLLPSPLFAEYDYISLNDYTEKHYIIYDPYPPEFDPDSNPDQPAGENAHEKILAIPIEDSDQSSEFYFIEVKQPQLRLILRFKDQRLMIHNVHRDIDELFRSLSLEPDLSVDHLSDLKLYLPPTTSTPDIALELSMPRDTLGQLLYSMGLLVAVAEVDGEVVYLLKWPDGSITSITAREFYQQLSIAFEAELEAFINGPLFPTVAPEVYRNGYALPPSTSGNSSYRDWCNANGFSRSDGHAYLRRKWSRNWQVLRSKEQLFQSAGISLEDVLKKIWMAPKKKKKGKNQNKVSPPPPAAYPQDKEESSPKAKPEEPPFKTGSVDPSKLPDFSTLVKSIEVNRVNHLELQAMSQVAKHLWATFFFLTGIDLPEANAQVSRETPTRIAMKWLKNSANEMMPSGTFLDLFTLIEQLGIYSPGSGARLKPSTVVAGLCKHFGNKDPRCIKLRRHISFFRLAIYQCPAVEVGAAQVMDCLQSTHDLLTRQVNLDSLKHSSPLFKRHLEIITGHLDMELEDDQSPSQQLIDAVIYLIDQYDLDEQWPLLAYNLGLPSNVLELFKSFKTGVREIKGEWQSVIHAIFKEALQFRDGFMDPLELSLALRESGLGIIASILQLPEYPRDASVSEMLIRFFDSTRDRMFPNRPSLDLAYKTPAELMLSGLLDHQRIGNAKVVLTVKDWDTQVDHLLIGHFPDTWRTVLNDALYLSPQQSAPNFYRLISNPSLVREEIYPAYTNKLPLGSRYMGTMIPSESQRHSLSDTMIFFSVVTNALHTLQKISEGQHANVILQGMWLELGTQASQLVIYSVPQSSPHTLSIRSNLKQLLLEWLLQAPVSPAESSLLFDSALQAYKQLDREASRTYLSSFISMFFKLVAIDESQYAFEFEELSRSFTVYEWNNEVTDPHLTFRELIHQWLYATAEKKWPKQSMINERSTDHFLFLRLTHPDNLRALLPGAIPQYLMVLSNHHSTLLHDAPSLLLQRSGPPMQNKVITVASSEGGEPGDYYSHIEQYDGNYPSTVAFFNIKPGLKTLTALLHDFNAWPLKTRVRYLKALIELIQENPSFQRPLHLQHLVAFDPELTTPGILLEPGLVQDFNPGAFAQLVLEIMTGQPLPEEKYPRMAQSISLLEKSCLKLLPYYLRPILELMNMAHWLPSTNTAPSITTRQLLPLLAIELENLNRNLQSVQLPSASHFIEGGAPPKLDALCSLPLHCHPDILAAAGMSCNAKHLFCPQCLIAFDHTRHVWEDLTLRHWLNSRQNCRKANQTIPTVALQHIPDFLVLCSEKFDQDKWLKGSMTKQDLDWLAQQDTAQEKWLLLAWLTGIQPEQIVLAYQQHQNNNQDLLKALFSGKAISRAMMIQATEQADTPLIHTLLTHNLVEPVHPSSTTVEVQSLSYQYALFLQQYPGLLDIQELEQRKLTQWQTAGIPSWLPLVSAIQEQHPATLPSLLHHSLESCKILAPDIEHNDSTLSLVDCIIFLADRHNLTEYWAVTGYFLGLDSKALEKISRKKNNIDRLRDTLNAFLNQNGHFMDPRVLGTVFSHSGLGLISRLLHFPMDITLIDSSFLVTPTLAAQINQRLHHQTDILNWVPLSLLHPEINRNLRNVRGIAEPAFLIEALNQQLRSHFHLPEITPPQKALTTSGHPPYSGQFSHLPYDGEVQAWWIIPLDQLQSTLPGLIEQIENAAIDLQKAQPMPDNVSIRLETGALNQHTPYLQFVLYKNLQTEPGPVPLSTDIARGLLGLFSSHHLSHSQSMQIAQSTELIAGLIRTRPILPASRFHYRQALAQLIHQWHLQPPQQRMTQDYRDMVENVRENSSWFDTEMRLIVPIAMINKGKTRGKAVQCKHCNLVLKSPKRLECCETTLCLKCINTAIQDSSTKTCPYCAAKQELSLLPYTDHESLAVAASNTFYQCRESGCSTSGTLDTLERHSWSRHNLIPGLTHIVDEEAFSWTQRFLIQRVIRQLAAQQQLSQENPLLTTYDTNSLFVVHVSDSDQTHKVKLVWQNSQMDILSEECHLFTAANFSQGARTRRVSVYACPVAKPSEDAGSPEKYQTRGEAYPVVQHSTHWPDTDRAQYLIQLRALLQTLNQMRRYPNFEAAQLVRFQNDQGIETAGILYTETSGTSSNLNTLTVALSVLAGQEIFPDRNQIQPADLSLILSHPLLPEHMASALLHFLQPIHDGTLGSIIVAHPHPTLSLSPGEPSSALYLLNHPNHPLVLTPLSLLQKTLGYGHQWYCSGCGKVHNWPLLNHCLVCPESSQKDETDFCSESILNQRLHHPPNGAALELRRSSLLNSHRAINANELALAGFQYNQESRQIECPQCQLNITPYLGQVNPWYAHQALRPGCPYIRPFHLPQPLSYSVGKLIDFIKDCYKKTQPEIPAAVLQQLGQTVLKEMHSYLGDSENQLMEGRINAEQFCRTFARATLEMARDKVCSICMDKISDVRLKPCGHAICNECLQRLMDNHKRVHPNDPLPCHKCREPMQGLENFR